MGKGILKQRRPDGVDVIELGWELANNSKAIVYKKAPGFRAIDGTTFDNERALRKYMYETFYSFRNYKNNKDLVKRDGEIGGQQMCLEKLENCEVKLLDVSDSLFWLTGLTTRKSSLGRRKNPFLSAVVKTQRLL